ncbi:IS630 family transposase [Burkholderia sp. MSMB1589WGS]|uniref:IS630 family transposase n=1 Tax=Burkholderia sp. MSMB1589WGS TaxID=1636425 RepID=UPI0007B86CEB|nr:IS630 family transposase [Burkholderia sp. MSMB1589WGS]
MRSLLREAREGQRRQVIGLCERGWTYDEIAAHTNLSRMGVFDICKRYVREGAAVLRHKPSGRAVNRGRAPTEQQEVDIRVLLRDQMPDQLKMSFALWTRHAGRELIRQRCGLALTLQGVGLYLARWGFTPQKPMTRAYEQRPEAVRTWLNETYPEIACRAKAESAESRSYAPMGNTPERRVMNRREGLLVISTVTNRGQVRLIKDMRSKKAFLILDNLKVHHARPVKAWLAEHVNKIEVFYLPSYSPELNPDEMLNAVLKASVTKQAPARIKGHLKKAAISHLRRLQKSPQRLARYFMHEPIRYAA